MTKGQKVDLTKGNPSLTKLHVGLGWDEKPKKSFFGLGSGANIDIDASVVMLDESGRIKSGSDLIYYANLTSKCGSVEHQGDNLTGAGDGDDEVVLIDLARIPSSIHKVVFVVNIYQAKDRKQDFGMIQNAFIRVLNQSSKEQLLKFNLSDDYAGKTALVVGEVYRHNGDWKFAAVGEGTTDNSLSELARRYQ